MKPLAPTDPREIGPYRLIAELGRGAMGRVYLGAGPDGRPHAVKLLREWRFDGEEFRSRFRREAAASKRVSGPYTAAVVDADTDADTPWLASEFLLGPTLGDAVDAVGALPEETVLRLAAGLASALAAIHRAGLVHRDLKPGNVILAADGPRVIDFGIAQSVDGSGGTDLTRTGGIIGTPGFMSPEQAESEPLSGASDVFSFGSVLVMASTGSGPFEADSTLRTLNNVVRAEPDLSGVPPRVRAIAERCLRRDPGARIDPAGLLSTIGTVAPAMRPWPRAVTALAEEQRRELERLLDDVGEGALAFGPEAKPAADRAATRIDGAGGDAPAEGTTLIDAGTTMLGGAPPVERPAPRGRAEDARRPPLALRRRTLVVGGLAAVAATAVTARLLRGGGSGAETGDREPEPPETTAAAAATAFQGDGPLYWPVYSPDGGLLASAITKVESDTTVHIWDAATGATVSRLVGGGNAGTLAFSPDGTALVSGGDTVHLWDLASEAITDSLAFRWAKSVGFSPDGSTVLIAGDKRMSAWDLATGRETTLVEDYSHFYHMEIGPDGVIATATGDGAELWDAATGAKTATLIGEPAAMTRFSPDGGLVAACGDRDLHSGFLRIWDAASGEPLLDLSSESTYAIAFSPDGALLASGNASAWEEDGVLLWDTATGEQVGHLEGESAIYQMNFAPDRSRIATTSDGNRNTVDMWELQ